MIWRGCAATATLMAAAFAPSVVQAAAEPTQGVVSYRADFFAAARPATAFDMIARLPGFTFDDGAQVRGFADAGGNVLIDGERPTSKQDDLEEILRRIPASQVERIDVIRGGVPSIDMQGRTLLANLVRRRGAGSSQSAVTLQDKLVIDDGGNLPSGRFEWSRRGDDHSVELGLITNRYIDDGTGPGPHTTRDGAGALTYGSQLWTRALDEESSLTGAYEGPLAGGKFKVNGLVFLQNYVDHEADTAFLPAIKGDDTYKDAFDILKSELGLHYERNLGARLTLETLAIQQLSRSHEHAQFLALGDDEVYAIGIANAESIVRATLRYRPAPSLTVEGALEAAYNTQGTQTFYSINDAPQPLPAANEYVSEKRGEAALSATWSPSPHYTLEAGLRLEESTVIATGDVRGGKTLFYPKPRVVFTWSPDPKDQVRLRAEREVGQLDFTAFSASGSLNVGGLHAGNPAVLPQQAWVGEIALERRFWRSGDATVTLRHLDITDAVDRIVGVAGSTPFDEGGDIPRGSENDLVLDVTVPLDRLMLKQGQLKLTATWRDTHVIDPTTGVERPQTQVHPLEMEAHFAQDLPGLKSSWGLDFVYGWSEAYYRFDEIDINRYGPRLTAFFEYKPTDRLSLRAEAGDLFSGGMDRSVALYGGPRNTNPAPYSVDVRDQKIGPLISLKVRRAFG